METLDGTEWDVVIAGTGFQQSLLALSLSHSGKRILHLDKNEYYGGAEAALSLSEAETWAERFSATNTTNSTFSNASVSKAENAKDSKLASSRAYALALAPQLIYSRSTLVPALISSRTHNQLDFQAVGSWFVVDEASGGLETRSKITRVPSGREDVFQDTSLDLKAKRLLMKFLRFVGNYEEQGETWHESRSIPFSEFLEKKFKLPEAVHAPIMALTMSEHDRSNTSTEFALPRIARHLRSIGVFGPGFGAVLPKWGGLAEITQVACRACAVGGGVYVLKKGIKSLIGSPGEQALLELSDGEKVSTRWLAGSWNGLQGLCEGLTGDGPAAVTSRSISVVSSPLSSLFPPTSEGGVTPAGAVVVVPSTDNSEPPVHILVHTSDAGECPMNQCVLYASIAIRHDGGFAKLDQAISALLQSVEEDPLPKVLWSMQFQQQNGTSLRENDKRDVDEIIILPPVSQDPVLEDAALEDVKAAWQRITGEDEEKFMHFEAREGMEDDEMY